MRFSIPGSLPLSVTDQRTLASMNCEEDDIANHFDWTDRKPLPVQAEIRLTGKIAASFIGTWKFRDFPTDRFSVLQKSDGSLYWARAGHTAHLTKGSAHNIRRQLARRCLQSQFQVSTVRVLASQ